MDLSAFGDVTSAEQGAVMTVCHPSTGAELRTADDKPITITLASSDSERVRRVTRRATNRRLQQARGGRATVTAEALEAEGLNALIAATIAWDGIALSDGPLPLSDDNARRVYTELPWLREQAQSFIDDRGNYSKSSQAA
ncbi:hypothetical protein [Methylorubrum aminovorans]|uniref:hypothetical protein n=1 Tax=Methylorubrum aminovorans TaxID=269069 RepID=UPI003C3089F0